MAKIIIKKRISLDYLGEEYADSYIIFKSISVREAQIKLDEIDEAGEDNKEVLKLMIKILQGLFIEGMFAGEKIVKEDIEDFDVESIIRFFKVLSGKDGDLKA